MKLSIAKDLGALRAEGLLRLDRAMKLARNRLLDLNSDVHAVKRAEALAIAAGATEGVPLLAAEAAATGRPLGAVAQDVLAKSAAALPAIAALEADRQRRQALIRAAATPAEIGAAIEGLADD